MSFPWENSPGGTPPHLPSLQFPALLSPFPPVPADSSGAPLASHGSIVAGQAHISSAAPTPPASQSSKTRIRLTKIGSTLIKSTGLEQLLQPVKHAVDELTNVLKAVGLAESQRQILLNELESLLTNLEGCAASQNTPEITSCVKKLCGEVQAEIDQILARQKGTSYSRYRDAVNDVDDVLSCHRRVTASLNCLVLNVNSQAWRAVNEQTIESRLNDLKQIAIMSGVYDSAESEELGRRSCTEKTRVEVLETIIEWAQEAGIEGTYWLNGMAGTGKTTIAYTLCEILKHGNMLGASFFCSRSLPRCRDTKLILPSIAYQLARFSVPFRSSLARVLEADPDVYTKTLKMQFKELIARPLQEVKDSLSGKKVVVVIDALDECENDQSVCQFLDLLIKEEFDLPIKFFLSSRPESQIYPRMSTSSDQHQRARPHLVLHDLEIANVGQDVKTFLQSELQCLDITESQLDALVTRSGVLFIYAATAARYILDGAELWEYEERLATILDVSTPTSSFREYNIDALYLTILAKAFDGPKMEVRSKERMKTVLWTVICAREPLSVNGIAGLLSSVTHMQAEALIRQLRSVLNVSGPKHVVSTLHGSFLDFMFQKNRSNRFHCPPAEHHATLTRACFDIIKRHRPQFNVCALQSSYALDMDIKDLDERANQAIPSEMYYGCRYWCAHLDNSTPESSLAATLEDFLSAHLLLWMEVLNVKKCISTGPRILLTAKQWISRSNSSQVLVDLAQDAWRFVTTFSGNSVMQSTPHIYVTMLAFWPEVAPVSRHYKKRVWPSVRVSGEGLQSRQRALLATWRFNPPIHFARFFTDQNQVVIIDDQSIRLVDGDSGHAMEEPFQWRYEPFLLDGVATSANNTLVAISIQSKLSVYDIKRRVTLLEIDKREYKKHGYDTYLLSPLNAAFVLGNSHIAAVGLGVLRIQGLQNGNNILTFLENRELFTAGQLVPLPLDSSPNGMSLVVGCADMGIRIWEIRDGALELTLGPLTHHRSQIGSVAFSPDGQRIISAGDGDRIHVLDAQGGQILLSSDSCPEMRLNIWSSPDCAVFSPNGSLFSFRTKGDTVQVHDSRTGQMVLGPLTHTKHQEYAQPYQTKSISFSPDSSRVALVYAPSQYDHSCTMQIWNVLEGSGSLARAEDQLENDRVMCIGCSPDGNSIVAGGKTVKIWDAQNGKIVRNLKAKEPSIFNSVEFSPDGTRVLAVTCDGTLYAWDLETGTSTICLKKSRGLFAYDSQYSATFSPDGTRILFRQSKGAFQTLDGNTGSIISHLNLPVQSSDSIELVRYLPDGSLVVVGFDPEDLRLWVSLPNHTTHFQLPEDSMRPDVFEISSNSRWLAAGFQGTYCCVWGMQEGQQPLWIYRAQATPPPASTPFHSAMQSVPPEALLPVPAHLMQTPGTAMFPLSTQSTPVPAEAMAMLSSALQFAHTSPNVKCNSVLQFSPDGMQILFGDSAGGIVLLEAQTGQAILGPLEGHSGPISSLSFFSNGRQFVSGSIDGTTRVWDVGGATDLECGPVPPSSNSAPANVKTALEVSWELTEDGWIVDSDNQAQHICWVPPDLRSKLLRYRNPVLMSAEGSVAVEFNAAYIGGEWTECYITE